MSNLQILSKSIRTFENLYSLNDIHKVSGTESKHQPTFFIRLDQTQELIAEFEQQTNSTAVRSFNGGVNRGTYACKELVIAYAAWISPAFHLTVLRAFLDQVGNPQPALPQVVEKTFTHTLKNSEMVDLAWLWFYAKRMADFIGLVEPALDAIQSKLAPEAYSMAAEYGMQINDTGKLIYRLTAEADFGDRPTPRTKLTENLAKPTKSLTRFRGLA